jgi:dihydropyrimidinase
MKDLLIKNGLVVTGATEETGDVLCRDGLIRQIGKNLEAAGETEIIDAAGKIVIPGGVDVHTHLNLDLGAVTAADDFYTGTVAAAWGGTTTIVDHIAFGPPGCPLDYQIRKYHDFARGRAVIDYSFHGVIQHVNDQILDQMGKLAQEGISSYKVYMTYGFKLDDRDLFRVLERAREQKLLITVHPENDGVINHLRETFRTQGKLTPAYHPLSRPASCEAEAVNRIILLAEIAGEAPLYIVHLSSARALEYIRAARQRGQKNLYAETCPQYLLLDESLYRQPGAEGLKYLMSPPLRSTQDQESLWEALKEDIDTIATDHCPFYFETQKLRGKDDFTLCPSGAPGIEERIALMYTQGPARGRISLRRFVELCSTAPAKIFGMYPRKGVIREGSDADLVLLDKTGETALTRETLHANVDYTAYEGFKVTGRPVCTISRGEVIVRDGVFTGKAGRGKFIPRLRVNEK